MVQARKAKEARHELLDLCREAEVKAERKSLKNGLKFVSSSLKTAAQLGWYVVPECKHELVLRQERMEHKEDPFLMEL